MALSSLNGHDVQAELFENMVHQLETISATHRATFRPGAARLEVISSNRGNLLLAACDEELGDFEE